MSSITDIDFHVRTYRSALKSSLEITISSLVVSHLKMESILHPLGNSQNKVDSAAFSYSLYRLPTTVDRTRLVVMGQNPEVFETYGFSNITRYLRISSPARRRTRYYDRVTKTGFSLISSISDVDDIVNLLIAYQVEWNKFHRLITTAYPKYSEFQQARKNLKFLEVIGLTREEWFNLRQALGTRWIYRLRNLYHRPQNIRLRLLAGSWIDYTKTVQRWYQNIDHLASPHHQLPTSKVYFVSSNQHSLLNLITGFPLSVKKDLLNLIRLDHPDLYQTYLDIRDQKNYLDESDFFYFIFKNYSTSPHFLKLFLPLQKELNITTVPNAHYLDVNTQIFPVSSLIYKHHDPRLKVTHPNKIKHSNSLILNIDYPLGFAAYHILNELLENISHIAGVYILGKAAVLNSAIGDLEVPRVVFDEHSQNTYMFRNCFNNFFPFINNQGSILTNQKAVSVLGTFLENLPLLDKYSENNFTCIEMESGPYLSALTESTYAEQLPKNTIIDLNSSNIDIGIINYTSDTPYSTARTLGDGFLGLPGVESVYLGSLAILQRIINLEESST